MLARITGTDDRNPLQRRLGHLVFAREAFAERADGNAKADEEQQREVEVDERDAPGDTQGGAGPVHAADERKQEDDEGRVGKREDHAQGIVQAKIIEDTAELTEQAQQDELQGDDPEQRVGTLGVEVALHVLIRRREDRSAGEAHLITQPERKRRQGPVDEEEEEHPLDGAHLGRWGAQGHGHRVRRSAAGFIQSRYGTRWCGFFHASTLSGGEDLRQEPSSRYRR